MCNKKELEKKIVEQYQADENMMILIFAQWCINNELEPMDIYKKAYPNQEMNLALQKVLELTVPKEEAEDIPDTTLLNVLQLFGNDDLAFEVTKEMEKLKKS
ncbi:hypothetical protein HNQ94_000729 [Salirhabdus euzebyi]|uniref:YxiS n=1 Tax=Salirhabdus euzebyi TaxID=394506 RepID=A0A841PWM2_9BACI|nr:hypothetical protein [Salirhabdus euzebyi]MBB6452284.1 hypothetical protein [Salirhabdus euzebyi]